MKDYTAKQAIGRVNYLIDDDYVAVVYISGESCVDDLPEIWVCVKIKYYTDDDPYPCNEYEEMYRFLNENEKNKFIQYMESGRLHRKA